MICCPACGAELVLSAANPPPPAEAPSPESDSWKSDPVTKAAMLARLRAADIDAMTEDQWGDFVNAMPRDEWLEMVCLPRTPAEERLERQRTVRMG